LLLLTGAQVSELVALELGAVRPRAQRTGELMLMLITRHGKGDRRRMVPLSRAALREWLADRAAHS
jgi:site-specific recombinase XerD